MKQGSTFSVNAAVLRCVKPHRSGWVTSGENSWPVIILGAELPGRRLCFESEMGRSCIGSTWPVGTRALSPITGLGMATARVFQGLDRALRHFGRNAWGSILVLTFTLGVGNGSAWALGSPSDLRAIEPTPRDIEQAAKHFDEGRAAFRKENYIEAAEAFEKADALAPNAKVLLLAIQSREMGGHLARAATLAALAEQRHPQDPIFADLGDLTKAAKEGLHFLTVTCELPCQITIGNRLIHGAPATRRYLYLEEGNFRIRANWGSEQALSRYYEAKKGTRGKLHFDASTTSEGSAAGDEDDWDSEPSTTKRTTSADDEGWDDGEWNDPIEPERPSKAESEPRHAEPSGSGLPPAVFWSGVAVTGVMAGASIWSGLHTLENPGKDTVVARCVGLGTSCPEYQEGLRNQTRTNVLWGITGGIGVLTAAIGAFWTNWDGDSSDDDETSHVSFSLVPVMSERPTNDATIATPRLRVDGSIFTASGRF